MFSMLNRDTQEERPMMAYPVTRIEIPIGAINERMYDQTRVFIVKDGLWHEILN